MLNDCLILVYYFLYFKKFVIVILYKFEGNKNYIIEKVISLQICSIPLTKN